MQGFIVSHLIARILNLEIFSLNISSISLDIDFHFPYWCLWHFCSMSVIVLKIVYLTVASLMKRDFIWCNSMQQATYARSCLSVYNTSLWCTKSKSASCLLYCFCVPFRGIWQKKKSNKCQLKPKKLHRLLRWTKSVSGENEEKKAEKVIVPHDNYKQCLKILGSLWWERCFL